jgi:hypothetical protein
MTELSEEQLLEPSHLWSVHSEMDDQPMIRAWCKSEEEANKLLTEMKGADEEAGKTEYWVMQLSNLDVQNFKASGFIPEDA